MIEQRKMQLGMNGRSWHEFVQEARAGCVRSARVV